MRPKNRTKNIAIIYEAPLCRPKRRVEFASKDHVVKELEGFSMIEKIDHVYSAKLTVCVKKGKRRVCIDISSRVNDFLVAYAHIC